MAGVFSAQRLAGKTVLVVRSLLLPSFDSPPPSAHTHGVLTSLLLACDDRRAPLEELALRRCVPLPRSSNCGVLTAARPHTSQAILFARAGASLILTARRQAQLEEVKRAAEQANKEGATGKGGKVVTLTLDMQDRKQIKGLLDRIPEELREVDVLVNNVSRPFCHCSTRDSVLTLHLPQAGLVYGREQVGDIDEDEIDTMINTNVVGLISLTQIFVKGALRFLMPLSEPPSTRPPPLPIFTSYS